MLFGTSFQDGTAYSYAPSLDKLVQTYCGDCVEIGNDGCPAFWWKDFLKKVITNPTIKLNMNRNIIKKNQYKGLKNLQRTLDNFFNETWWPTLGTSGLWEEFQPHSKLTEDKDNYYVETDLPGLKKEEVKIEVEENILRLHGERKEKKHHENSKQHYSEIFYGSFTREFALPTSIEKEAIKAHYENGVLSITVPKSLKSKAHRINID